MGRCWVCGSRTNYNEYIGVKIICSGVFALLYGSCSTEFKLDKIARHLRFL